MPFEQFRRNRDRANTFMERMMNGAFNHELLTEVLGEGCEKFLDHVYELSKDQMTKFSLPDVAKYNFNSTHPSTYQTQMPTIRIIPMSILSEDRKDGHVA
ncbi:hypothetical protein N7463_000526 [Penicillium fimorum]|uniref:Uncharacterized protein n=1 Tax=Penicillium fimorum TaxID=1882269 RepID=A0A9W9Y641_9EURO|nr:hypothetical protein N7463_000526 [Penicillium fimorum]